MMDLNKEIPGYYYDAEKKKYFKIKQNAPATATYSTENVKRRKIQDHESRRAQEIAAQTRKLVPRCPALQHPLLGGFLATEFGNHPKDHQANCWARGLCYKGSIALHVLQAPHHHGIRHDYTGLARQVIEHLYIGNADEKTGLGVAFGAWEGGWCQSALYAAYMPRDENDQVVWDTTDTTQPFGRRLPAFMTTARQVSSVKYHQPSHKILITELGLGGGLMSLSPGLSDTHDTSKPAWDIGQPNVQYLWPGETQQVNRVANTCAPAPAANSSLVCVVGTNEGLGCFSGNGKMVWLENTSSVAENAKGNPSVLDVLSLDFLPSNPQVILAGIRGSRRICLVDLRQRAHEWDWIVHRSSPAHVRCVNEHHVLAAGPMDSMSIYDIRFRHRKTSRNKPIVVFPDFKNKERIHFGLDIDTTFGVVATGNAAQAVPGGAVSVFSLETGRKLAVPELDSLDSALGVKALMFQTLPRETNPSLFVGGGSARIHKFSLGSARDEWSGEPFGPPLSDLR